MKLTTDARIITSEGQDIGNLNRFVLDPRSKKVTHIIFGRGLLSQKEYVIPMRLIERVTDEAIFLKPLPVNIEDLPPFKEEYFVLTNERALINEAYFSAAPTLRMYYHYPPTAGGILPPNKPNRAYDSPSYTAGVAPLSVTGSDELSGFIDVNDNIPDHTVALKEGAKVFSNDSKHLGNVEKVIVDPTNNKSTHLVITKGLLLKEKKLVPMNWVDNIYDNEVYLCMDQEFVDKVPDYKG